MSRRRAAGPHVGLVVVTVLALGVSGAGGIVPRLGPGPDAPMRETVSVPPRPTAPAAPVLPAPQLPAPDLPASDRPAPDLPASDRPAPDRPLLQPAPDRPALDDPAPGRPASSRPAPDEPGPDLPASSRPAPNQPAPDRPAPNQPARDPARPRATAAQAPAGRAPADSPAASGPLQLAAPTTPAPAGRAASAPAPPATQPSSTTVLLPATAPLPGATPRAADAGQVCGTAGPVPVADGRFLVLPDPADPGQCLVVRDGGFEVVRAGAPGGQASLLVGCRAGTCSSGGPLPRQVATLTELTSSWSVRVPADGEWTIGYTLDFAADAGPGASTGPAVAVRLDSRGAQLPPGTAVDTVVIGDATWQVWVDQGGGPAVSYVRERGVTDVDGLDLAGLVADAVRRGVLSPDLHLTGVRAGFVMPVGGAGLATTSFSLDGPD